MYNSGSNNGTSHQRKLSVNDNFDETLPQANTVKHQKTSSDNNVNFNKNSNNNNSPQDFASVLNEIFESSSINKLKKNDTKIVATEPNNNFSSPDTNENHINMPKYDSEKFKNILQEMDKLYKNINVEDSSKENTSRIVEAKKVKKEEVKPKIEIDDILNQSYRSTTSKIFPPEQNNNGNSPVTNTVINNNNNSIHINTNTIINKDVFNYFKQTENVEKNVIELEQNKNPLQTLNSHKSEVSNINIYNIHNNINTIRVEEKIDLEKLANTFLFQELSKTSLHWLISSKDIQIEKQIGFGGSSEVYQANYRGTDVAVKKLRILDVKEENLKEFKREVYFTINS